MRIVLRATVLLALASLLLLASAAQATPAVFTVTRMDDVAGTTCAANDCSLRQAISAADAAGTATVMIPAGTYTLSITGANEDDNLKGDLDTTGNITIKGAGESQTFIDANHIDQAIHGHQGTLDIEDLTIENGGSDLTVAGGIYTQSTLTLNNVTVTGGNAGAIGGTGGVLIYAPSTITNSTITNNKADNDGSAGGLFTKGPMTLTNSLVSNNHVTGNGGGAGGILSLTDTTVTDSTISGNAYVGGTDLAGGIYLAGYNGTHTFTNVTISDNTGTDDDAAGGLWNTGTMTASKLTVTGNHGANGGPGGIWNEGPFTVTDLIVDNNDTDLGSGGIFASMFNFDVNRGQISHNSSGSGDQSAAAMSVFSEATLKNTTVDTNLTPVNAFGGIYIGSLSPTPTLNLENATLHGNAIGAINNHGIVHIKNSILAANGLNNCIGTDPVSTGVNIDSGISCGVQAPGLPATDPLLQPLADNGGFVKTDAIASNSPARDAAQSCPTPSEDARGVTRPVGTACDVGAFEFGSTGLIWADANCDGSVNGFDSLSLLQRAANLNPQLPPSCPGLGDAVFQGSDQETWGDWTCTGGDPTPYVAIVPLEYVALGFTGPGGSCPAIGSVVTVQQP